MPVSVEDDYFFPSDRLKPVAASLAAGRLGRREAVRIGRQAEWFPGLDTETILGEDIDALRSDLKLRKPVIYNEIVARVRANSPWQSGPWVHVASPVDALAAA